MTKTRRISASQVELFGRCERRWAYSYIAGQREPFAEAAQAGTEVHSVVEHDGPYDKEWNGYAVGQMAALLKSQMPDGVLSHEQRYEVEIDGVPLVGVVDAQTIDTVIDLKTTSRVKNAKSIAKLTEDPQRLMYTQFIPDATSTLWLYGVWETMTVTPRRVEVDRAADKERFKLRVLQPAERMLSVAADADPLSLKPNVNDCALFPAKGGGGGCPHKSKCFPPGKFLPAVTNSKESDVAMSSLIEKLRAKAAAEGQPVVPPQPAPEPAPAAVASEPEVVQSAQQPEIEQQPESAPAASAQAAEEPKKRRGRPRKVEQEAPASESVSAPQAPAGSEVVSYKETPEQIEQFLHEVASGVLIGTLFIDCLPLCESYELASKYIAVASETVANDAHVPHPLLIDFSRGGPAIAAQLRADLSGKHINALYVETKTAEAKACLQVLMSVAGRTVKGVF